MALNPNHSFEDLGDIKCSIIEKNCNPERVSFLKALLEFNKFKVVVVNSPAPKAAKAAPVAEGETAAETIAPILPETFTVGVTDLTFNPTNAIFNRELNTPTGEVVTPNFWYQKEAVANEGGWYWKK